MADARVEENFPTTNFGTQTSLRSDGSPNEMSYLRFDVQGSPTKATLRLWVRDGTVDAPGVAGSADTSWSETGITWANKPGYGPIVSDLGKVTTATWIEYDVTGLVTGPGPVTFVLVPQSSDALSVESKQSSTVTLRPQLILENSGTGTSRVEATPTSSATPSPSATATATTTATASPSPTETSGTTSLVPVADARVSLSSPANNYGATQTLLADTQPQESSYLRFDVPDTTGTVTSATLRLWVVDATSNAPAVATSADTTWSESSITWNTKPPVGPNVADLGSIQSGRWVEYDVTAAVTGPGAITFVFVAQSSNGADFASRESAQPPELVITWTGGSALTQSRVSSEQIAPRSDAPSSDSDAAATPETTVAATPAPTTAMTPTPEPTVATIPEPTEAVQVITGTVVNTGGSNLRCRATASLDGEVIAQLPEGTQVIVRGPQEGDWLPIVCGDQDGYAAAAFIVIATTVDGADVTPTVAPAVETLPTPAGVEATVSPTAAESPADQPAVEPTPTEVTIQPTPLPIRNGWQDDPTTPWWWTTDDDLTTTWSGYASDSIDEVELGYDLGEVTQVSHLRWQPTWPLQGTMEIQLSNDGINWYRLRSIDLSQQIPDEWAEIPVHTQARYINLVFTNPPGAGQVGAIREMQVWAETSGTAQVLETLPLIVPTPVPVPTEAPQAIPTDVPPEPTPIPTEIPVVEPTVPPPPETIPADVPAEPAQEVVPDGT